MRPRLYFFVAFLCALALTGCGPMKDYVPAPVWDVFRNLGE